MQEVNLVAIFPLPKLDSIFFGFRGKWRHNRTALVFAVFMEGAGRAMATKCKKVQ